VDIHAALTFRGASMVGLASSAPGGTAVSRRERRRSSRPPPSRSAWRSRIGITRPYATNA